jgi:hypothetical protein
LEPSLSRALLPGDEGSSDNEIPNNKVQNQNLVVANTPSSLGIGICHLELQPNSAHLQNA